MSTSRETTPQEVGKEILEEAKEHAESPLVRSLNRFGFLMRGLLYIVIGLLALKLAFGMGGATTDPVSAIIVLGGQPFGDVLLALIAVGLSGYALWGFIRAILDPLDRGNDLNGLIDRAGFLLSGVSYAAMVVPTVQMLLSKSNGPFLENTSTWWSKVATEPWGKWVVIGFGLFWVGVGIGQLVEAFTARFLRDLKLSRMSEEEIKTATWVGKSGYAARGVVFALIGITVLEAFFTDGSKHPRGIDDALTVIWQAQYGSILLGVVATGLIMFGIYSGLCAQWNRVVNDTHK